MPAFLEKLRRLTASCPGNVGGWTEDGRGFEVKSIEFEALLKNYFKGSLKTFVRQLHFYGFKKSETIKGHWTFSHPKFTRDNPEGILEIRRKSKKTSSTPVTQEQLTVFKSEMNQFRNVIESQVNNMQARISQLDSLVRKFVSREVIAVKKRKLEDDGDDKAKSEDIYSTCVVKQELSENIGMLGEELDNMFCEYPLPLLDGSDFQFDFS